YVIRRLFLIFFFFFQAEDGIRDFHVTGVQTCALPIYEGIRYAHDRKRKVLLALNTYPQPDGWQLWRDAVDRAAGAGVDAVIMADPGLMAYACERHPGLRLHLSVQGSATNYEAIRFYHDRFGVARAVLPRVLSVAQVQQVCESTPVEIEVFGFGSLC